MATNLVDKRKKILIKTAGIFRRKSFQKTTINDIASVMKINKAMIYYYFPSKESLLYEIVSNAADNLIEEARAIANTDSPPLEKVKALVKLHIKSVSRPSSLGGVAPFELRNLPYRLRKAYIAKRDIYEEIFQRLLRKVAEDQSVNWDPRMVGRVVLCVLNSVPMWFKGTGPLSSAQVADEIWSFISRSIENPNRVQQRRH